MKYLSSSDITLALTIGKTMKVINKLSVSTVTHEWPRNLLPADKALFARLQKRELEEINIYHLSQVKVLAEGMVVKGMKVYKNLLLSNDQEYINCPNWKGLLSIYLSYKKQILSEDTTYILVHNCYSHTYYHWLVEVLPRLFLVKDLLETGTVLMPVNHNQPFHQDALGIFGVNQVQQMSEKCIYKIHKLLVPSQIGRVANYHPEVIRQTIGYIKSHLSLQLNLGDKVYVSRSKATYRKILNEEEVITYLKDLGFVIVHFEDYSFAEQVSIMHHCRYLVSIHGAGLSNMIFMPAQGHVFELRKDDRGKNYFFYTLTSTVRHYYYYQFCESPDEGVEVQEADIEVDMKFFKKNITLMLEA